MFIFINNDSSDIDKLIEDMNSNQLNQNENATVNSILQELNGDNTQQSKPQITDEEQLLRPTTNCSTTN